MTDIVAFEVDGLPVYVEVRSPEGGLTSDTWRPDRHDPDDPIEKRESGADVEADEDDDLPGPVLEPAPARSFVSEGVRSPAPDRRWRRTLEQVRPAVVEMIDVFKTIATPEEVSVEFGLTFSSRVNAFVFSSDGEATFKVALKWSNERGRGSGGRRGEPAAAIGA